MIRLILFIVIFGVFLAFIIFNLDNKCDISLGIMTFNDIPVFLSSFFSFVVGMLFAIPLIVSFGKKRKKNSMPESSKKMMKDGQHQGTDEIKKEKSPYGID